ncbi:MAG: hypothetical protein E7Z75_02155 [Methanobrevibacter olleyae]|uniref:Uncharacterized protein n=1 Tax=Methanobrevibacter olleyae TaxID=294671 RepID=A0A8T3VL31_METOL|nr:hypothetical protein [Methanobrevibacter olleyae]
MSFSDTWAEWDTSKKILAIFAVCCILAIIAVVAFGGIGTGSQVKVTYNGPWSGVIHDGNTVKVIRGYGNQTFDLDCDDSDVIHTQISKQDAGFGDLKVQILRNGEVVKQSTSSIPYGFVTLTDG